MSRPPQTKKGAATRIYVRLTNKQRERIEIPREAVVEVDFWPPNMERIIKNLEIDFITGYLTLKIADDEFGFTEWIEADKGFIKECAVVASTGCLMETWKAPEGDSHEYPTRMKRGPRH